METCTNPRKSADAGVALWVHRPMMRGGARRQMLQKAIDSVVLGMFSLLYSFAVLLLKRRRSARGEI